VTGRRADLRRWWQADDGRVTAFVAVVAVALIAMIGLTLDAGLALATKVNANGQAEAAARAGAQAIDLTAYRVSGTLVLLPAEAEAAATAFLNQSGAQGTVEATGDSVSVVVTATRRTQILGLLGIEALTVTGEGSAHPQRGVDGIEP
jgi:Flp pilus assembly protein TadG